MLLFTKLYHYFFTAFMFLVYFIIITPIGFFIRYILKIELYSKKYSSNKSYKEKTSDKNFFN